MFDQTENELISALMDELRPIQISLATRYPVKGMDVDDIVQELNIKMWDVVKKGKYDPMRCKPTSYFWRVFFNHIVDLNRKRVDDMLDHCSPLYDEHEEGEVCS